MDKAKFLGQISAVRVELRRRGLSRWPVETQQRCVQLVAEGIFNRAELSQVMGVGQQTLYNWQRKWGHGGFRQLRVVTSSNASSVEAISPTVMISGFEVHLGTFSVSQLKGVLECLR